MRRSALIVCPVPTHPTKQDGDPNCHTVIFLIAGQRRKVKRELGCDQEVSERMKSLGQCGDDRLDLDRILHSSDWCLGRSMRLGHGSQEDSSFVRICGR